MKTIRANYGLVFTAYGAGALIGNLLAGHLRDLVGSYVVVFYPVAVLAIAGIVISFFLIRQPDKASRESGGRSPSLPKDHEHTPSKDLRVYTNVR